MGVCTVRAILHGVKNVSCTTTPPQELPTRAVPAGKLPANMEES